MKAVIFTLGCKVNQYEGQQIALRLAALGFDTAVTPQPADLYVLNTCSVTAEADRKSRQAVTRLLKLNPDAGVIIVGCSSQNDAEIFKRMPNVIAAGGTSDKAEFVAQYVSSMLAPAEDKSADIERFKTRAYVKIQDGCNRFCSYCIVPHLRGRSRSAKSNRG